MVTVRLVWVQGCRKHVHVPVWSELHGPLECLCDVSRGWPQAFQHETKLYNADWKLARISLNLCLQRVNGFVYSIPVASSGIVHSKRKDTFCLFTGWYCKDTVPRMLLSYTAAIFLTSSRCKPDVWKMWRNGISAEESLLVPVSAAPKLNPVIASGSK